MSFETTCAFTGHRPEKLPFPSCDQNCDAYVRFRGQLTREICRMAREEGVKTFLSGGARGVDTWAMEAVSRLKYYDPSIRLIAVLPFRGHNPFREPTERQRYELLLARCDRIVYVSEQYHPACFHARNRWMVDHAAHLLAVYDGVQKGGTAYTQWNMPQSAAGTSSPSPRKYSIRGDDVYFPIYSPGVLPVTRRNIR